MLTTNHPLSATGNPLPAPVRQVVRCVPEAYGEHRYLLEIQLAAAGPCLTVILKNPSTADAHRSDPTIGKVEAWARRHNFGRLLYVNLFALRSTRPTPLNFPAYEQAVGAENDYYIRQAVVEADTVVLAWGNSNGILPTRYDRRIGEVLILLAGYQLHTVGLPTRQGYPRHGLLWNHQPELASVAGQELSQEKQPQLDALGYIAK